MKEKPTFEEMPQILATLVEQIADLQLELQIQRRAFEKSGVIVESRLPGKVLGKFHENECIEANDSRLWEGESAPFKSQRAVEYARKHQGAPFFMPPGTHRYRIRARDLQDWLLNAPLREQLGWSSLY